MLYVGIVVVTYNRLNCLEKNISCLMKLQKPDNIRFQYVIVDNCSTDGTREYLDKYSKNDRFHIIHMKQNTGGSGGFYTGVKYCMDHRYDYVWGMDDDAYPHVDALSKLLEIAVAKANSCCFWSNCNNDQDFSEALKEVNQWMFVGFFIPTSIIKSVGLPRRDFFIYHDDSEYAYRIRKKGYKIYKVRDSLIDHKDGLSKYFSGKSFFGHQITNYSDLPDWKRYYDVRNMLLMYQKTDINYWKILLSHCPKTLIATKAYNPSQLSIVKKAISDGIRRKSGKTISP